jgi:hypothetical protein
MCCFAPVRPIYKKNVDDIFPSSPQDGIVNNKLDSLIYYVTTNPEKFDRIGEYLRQRIARHVYRGRKQLVFIGMQAMDRLLLNSTQHLSLFIDSFLDTIQELLESSDPDYQVKASLSFEQFSKIQEDAPSYHRAYDFFIAKFSQMSHSLDVSLRISGLQGLMSVLRKTMNEELAQNIWEQQHMGKIVPSLLINLDERPNVNELKHDESNGIENMDRITSPGRHADQILRELVRSASDSHLKIIISQVLAHIDSHQMWDGDKQERTFYIFQAVAYSMQVDSSHILIQSMLSHLQYENSIAMKCNIAAVLCKIIGIGVDDTRFGLAVIEITSTLLKNLCSKLTKSLSMDKLAFPEDDSSEALDKGRLVLKYQTLLLSCIGQYTGKMPDFQKQETMMSILSKIPSASNLQNIRVYESLYSRDPDQHILMKAFFVVAEKSCGELFSSSFNFQILYSLLDLLHAQEDHDVRFAILQSIQVLVDPNRNFDKLVSSGLTMNPSNIGIAASALKSYHHAFAKKDLTITFNSLSSMLSKSFNTKEFLELMYITVVIITVEMRSIEKTAGILLNFIEEIQNAAIKRNSLTTDYRFGLHALAISLLAFLVYLVPSIVDIDTHLQNIINARSSKANHLLPPVQESYSLGLNPDELDDDLLIVPDLIKDALKGAGKDIEQSNFLPQTVAERREMYAKVRPESLISQDSGSVDMGMSSTETLLNQSEETLDQVDSCIIKTDTSPQAFKEMLLLGTSQEEKDSRKRKGEELRNKFLFTSFTDLCLEAENNKHDLEGLVTNIFTKLSFGEVSSASDSDEELSIMDEPEPYERFFPELYIC